MEQQPENNQEADLVQLYEEAEIEVNNDNDIWLTNKRDIEKFIYEKELNIDILSNYSTNLITYYNNKIKQVEDLKLNRSDDTEKNLEGDATIQILQEKNIPKIIEKYGEKYNSDDGVEQLLIQQYKNLIGRDTTPAVIKADYDERFKVIRYDLLIKEYEKNIRDIEIDLNGLIELDNLTKEKNEKAAASAAANIIGKNWKARQKWLYDNQIVPYIGSEVVEQPESRYILIDGCKDTVVEIPADCSKNMKSLKQEIADKMRADNPDEPCLTKINNKIEKINKKCPIPYASQPPGPGDPEYSKLYSKSVKKTRKGGQKTRKGGKKTKKRSNTKKSKDKQIIIGGTKEDIVDYIQLFDIYKDTISYGLLQNKLSVNLSVLYNKYVKSLEDFLYPGYFDIDIDNIKDNITDIKKSINGGSNSNNDDEDEFFDAKEGEETNSAAKETFKKLLESVDESFKKLTDDLRKDEEDVKKNTNSSEQPGAKTDTNSSDQPGAIPGAIPGAKSDAEAKKEEIKKTAEELKIGADIHTTEKIKQNMEKFTNMSNNITQLTNAIVERQKQLDEALKTEETELTDDMNKVLTINKEIEDENEKIKNEKEEDKKDEEEYRKIEEEEEEEEKKQEEMNYQAIINGKIDVPVDILTNQNNNKYAKRSMLTEHLMKFLKDCDILNSVPEWRAEISTAVLAFVTGSAENPNNLQRIVLDLSYKYFNLILLGTPGVGKTYTAGIIGKALHHCGFLTVGKKIDIKKPDLIGEYTGQTAPKVYKELTRGLGNVIFIDEAYSIAGAKDEKTNKYDSYGQEALDALTDYTSEHIGLMSVIAAGYEYEMNKQFLDVNTGLRRRFPTLLTLPRYDLKSFWKILESYLKKFVERGDIMNTHKACFELQNLMFNYQCNPNPQIQLSKNWKELSQPSGLNTLTKISIVLTDVTNQNKKIELYSIEKFNELIEKKTPIDSKQVLIFNENIRTKLPNDPTNITYTYIKSYIIYKLCSPTLYNGDFYRSQSDNLKKFASSILEYMLLQNTKGTEYKEIEDFYFSLFFSQNPNTKIYNLDYSIINTELKFNITANLEKIYLEPDDAGEMKDLPEWNETIIKKFIDYSSNITPEKLVDYIYISILCKAYITAKFQYQEPDGPDKTDSWWFFSKSAFQIIVDQMKLSLPNIIKTFMEGVPDAAVLADVGPNNGPPVVVPVVGPIDGPIADAVPVPVVDPPVVEPVVVNANPDRVKENMEGGSIKNKNKNKRDSRKCKNKIITKKENLKKGTKKKAL